MDLNPDPEGTVVEGFLKRCNELRQWFIKHSGERPRRRSLDQTEVSLALWLDRSMKRRTDAWNSRPCARRLTPPESKLLNSILVQVVPAGTDAPASSSWTTATDLKHTPEGFESPDLSNSKRLRQKLCSQVESVPDVASKRSRTHTTPHTNRKAVTLGLRGLNIQWPFSQLLLMGAKLEEVRGYPLDYRGIAKTEEEVWIVETKGPVNNKGNNAILNGIQIADRPTAAQIVGTIRFASAQQYYNKQAFHDARDRHRIKAGSKFDWDDNRRIYGWQVSSVRALAAPIPVGATGQVGLGVRGFSVVFATTAAQHDRSVIASIGEDEL